MLATGVLFDVNRDDHADLLFIESASQQVGVALGEGGDGRGRFAAPTPIVTNVPGLTARGSVAAVVVGDFDAAALPAAVAVNSTMRDPTFATVSRAGACLLP